jgi:hypothetical protein
LGLEKAGKHLLEVYVKYIVFEEITRHTFCNGGVQVYDGVSWPFFRKKIEECDETLTKVLDYVPANGGEFVIELR